MPGKNSNFLIFIASILAIFTLTIPSKAAAATNMISIKAGPQFLSKNLEIARTDAEQDQTAGAFGIGIESRTRLFTWGGSLSSFRNKWETKIPSSRTDGTYTFTTLGFQITKPVRIYRDYFFYGGGGFGWSFFENRYNLESAAGNRKTYDRFWFLTLLGTVGLERRFDSGALFLETQLVISTVSDVEAESESQYSHFDGIFAPRVMLGYGFFF